MIRPLLRPAPIEKKHLATPKEFLLQPRLVFYTQLHRIMFKKIFHFALLFIYIAIFIPALLASPTSPGKWSGAMGTAANALPHFGTSFPKDSWTSLAGTLTLATTKPSSSAPHGGFTFSLILSQGSAILTFKGKGSIQSDGRIEWSGPSQKSPLSVLSLVPSGNSTALRGNLTVSGQTFPVLAYRALFDSTSPAPPSQAGTFNLFATGLGGTQGTSIGSATISPLGAIRLAAITPNGRKIAASTLVISDDSDPFFALISTAKNLPAFSATAFEDFSLPESDWSGIAAVSASPVPWTLARFVKPPAFTPIVPWSNADLYLEHPHFLFSTGAAIRTIDRKLAITLNSGQFVRSGKFSYASATGAFSGTIQYSSLIDTSGTDKLSSATVRGLLNQKTGDILGFVLPAAKNAPPGIFDILPLSQ